VNRFHWFTDLIRQFQRQMNLLLHSASSKNEIPSFGTQITLAQIKSRVHGGDRRTSTSTAPHAQNKRKKIPSLPQRNNHGTPDPGASESQPNPTLETLQSNQEAPLPVGGRRWAAAGSQSRSRRQGERGEIPLPCLAQLALMEMEVEVEVEQTGMGRAWSGGARARCSPPRLLWGLGGSTSSHSLTT